MDIKKINFKEKKYVMPLLALPFLLLFAYVGAQFSERSTPKPEESTELSLSLGETRDSILTKNDAYDAFFRDEDNRTMLDGLDKEQDSLLSYQDRLSMEQKSQIDSMRAITGMQNQMIPKGNPTSYYNPNRQQQNADYQRSSEIIRMLNDKSYDGTQKETGSKTLSNSLETQPDPAKYLREQMLVMDSLERSRDPEYQARLLAEQKLKSNREKMDAFLNSTVNVSKSGVSRQFNAIYSQKPNGFIKAVIDEDNKGFMGSRIRFRLLEDISVGKHKISKGSVLYGDISGFSMQRVDIRIVSVFESGEIMPVHLSIYDTDGMKGLYVPRSLFRDMIREMGNNTVQGQQMDIDGEGFFTSLGSKLFTSTSKSIANLIKTNKAKLKYNSYVFLMDERQLQEVHNQQKN